MKSNLKFIISAMLILSINVIGCNNTNISSSLPKGGNSDALNSASTKIYEDSANGIKMKYPENWSMQEAVAGTLVYFAPTDGTGFFVKAGIAIETLSANIELDKFTESILEEAAINYNKAPYYNYKFVKSEKTTISQKTSAKVIFTFDKEQLPYKSVQVYIILDKKLIVCSFITEDVKDNKYDILIEEMIKSIEIK